MNKKKIAVIGGGVGAITSTYAITQIPNWQDKYEITLYQLGWRLGGKGASGRNLEKGGRIEEHGLHIWAGFYENGFRLMRDCYEQLALNGLRDPEAPLGTLDKAFTGLNHFLLAENVPNAKGEDEVHPWRIDFFPNSDVPGTGGVLPTPFAYFQMVIEFVEYAMGKVFEHVDHKEQHTLPDKFHNAMNLAGLSHTAPSPVHHLRAYAAQMSDNAFDHKHTDTHVLHQLTEHAQGWLVEQNFHATITNDFERHMVYMSELAFAFFKGTIASGLFRKGFDAIDDWEISAWLLHYGASEDAVYSAIFRGCFDYVFGYPGGITGKTDGSVGAGTSIRGLLRLAFTYKGSLFFKMMAGMGDTIFGPYYQVLKHRGVKFEYFNAATNLVLDDDASHISAIDMVRQVEMKSGGEYDPLVDVKGLPCWPSEPMWDQLKGGAALKKKGVDFESEKNPPAGQAYQLVKGKDFDEVILGASIGSLHYMASELKANSTRWQKMLENVGTVATHAAQFWVDKTPEELGWIDVVKAHNSGPQDDLRTVITGFREPLDTWADMTDLLPREDWGTKEPKSLAYFCSPAHDADNLDQPFKKSVKDWANDELTQLWPNAKKGKGMDFSVLHSPDGGTPAQKFDYQYFRENYYGSERYVLSEPNTVQYRLAPDQSGFENLYLAGDWTRCGINAGCVEAASISGLMAARGLTGADIEIVGEGDLEPDAGPSDTAKLASPYAQTAPWPITPFYGVGRMDGWFSFHNVDAAYLQSILPKGLTLQPQSISPEGMHPVTLLANHQMGVRASFLPELLGFRPYMEAIVAINYIGVDGKEGSYSYLPDLYLNSLLPKIAGRLFYRYNKNVGKIQMDNSRYQVETKDGSPIWSGKYAQKDFAKPLSEFAEFGAIKNLIEQPVVSRGWFSKFRYSAFDFGLSTAYAAAVSADITVSNTAYANLPTGDMHASPLGSDTSNLPGAFRIWTDWTLTNPIDSRRIQRVVGAQTHLP